jgi:phage portal protein BeeE
MSWFKRSKPEPQPEVEVRAADPSSQECTCTSDSLSFEALFTSQFSSRSLSAVYACIELISNAVSSMPLRVVKESEDGHREVVKHHPVQRIFKGRNIQTMTISAIIKSAI